MRLLLAEHLTALRCWCKQCLLGSVENPRAPPRHCQNARIYGIPITAINDIEYTPSSLHPHHPGTTISLRVFHMFGALEKLQFDILRGNWTVFGNSPVCVHFPPPPTHARVLKYRTKQYGLFAWVLICLARCVRTPPSPLSSCVPLTLCTVSHYIPS